MSLSKITSHCRCDGCLRPIFIDLDPAASAEKSLHSVVCDALSAGLANGEVCSYQGGCMLCGNCTYVVDETHPDDAQLTHEQVRSALAADRD